MKVKIAYGDTILTGKLLNIKDRRATVVIDGFGCSDSFPVADIVEAWT